MTEEINFTANPLISPEKATDIKGYPHPGSVIAIPSRGGEIFIQFGHPQDVGRNGAFIPEVLTAIIDHLKVYQEPGHPLASRETALAITKLEESRMWLEERRRDRERRQVLWTDKA